LPPINCKKHEVGSRPPTKYDEIAIIEASSKNSWSSTDQGKTEKVVERLKKEAAALGANGVLLQGFGNEIEAMVGTGSGTAYGTGNTMHFPVKHKSGKGLAIFVFDE